MDNTKPMPTNTELIEELRRYEAAHVVLAHGHSHAEFENAERYKRYADALEAAEADSETLAVNGLTRADVAEMARVYGVARFLGVTVEDIKAFAAERAKTENGAS